MRAPARIRRALPGLFRTAPGRSASSGDAPCPQPLNATPVFRYSPRRTARGYRAGHSLVATRSGRSRLYMIFSECNHWGAVRQHLTENTRGAASEAPWARKSRRAECHAAGGQRATGPAPWTWPHDRDRPQDPEKCRLFGYLSRAPQALGQRPRQRPCSRMTGSGAMVRIGASCAPSSLTPRLCMDGGAPWRHDHHLDHKRSRRQGGTDDPANLAWRCARCHARKTAEQDGRWSGWSTGGGGSNPFQAAPHDRLLVKFKRPRN